VTIRRTLPQCGRCGTEIPYAARDCVGCGRDVGFPNIRAAESEDEVEALRERVRYAQEAARARECEAELEAFGTAASSSQAVMTRGLAALDTLANQSNQPMTTYYKAVRAGARIPENNEYDQNRDRIDSLVNPFGVHENIQYAALSLDSMGVEWYGDYSITFRDSMIDDRSSVFEENPFRFCEKHHIPPTASAPAGYRATWIRRAELAIAKLHPRIQPGMTPVDFPGVLVEQGAKSADSDFIEVHIYGAIHGRAIERVVARAPQKGPDRVIWRRTKLALEKLGAKVDEV
jgi:hypothetical protein